MSLLIPSNKKGKYSRKKRSAPTTLAVFAFEKKTAMKEHSVTTSGVSSVAAWHSKRNQGDVERPISLNFEDVRNVNLRVAALTPFAPSIKSYNVLLLIL